MTVAIGAIVTAIAAGVLVGLTNGSSETVQGIFRRLRQRFSREADGESNNSESSSQFGEVHVDNSKNVQIGNGNRMRTDGS
ncbi:RIP homotypic interaction motif-containing protein [Streptomyces sp. NPDC001914]|uniref:RIP homotypic interaction motif-containing protein n=1 Tax=Streptomyces sp. NPDC001914 TaxID=3364623 RepID=UPI0036828C20